MKYVVIATIAVLGIAGLSLVAINFLDSESDPVESQEALPWLDDNGIMHFGETGVVYNCGGEAFEGLTAQEHWDKCTNEFCLDIAQGTILGAENYDKPAVCEQR